MYRIKSVITIIMMIAGLFLIQISDNHVYGRILRTQLSLIS